MLSPMTFHLAGAQENSGSSLVRLANAAEIRFYLSPYPDDKGDKGHNQCQAFAKMKKRFIENCARGVSLMKKDSMSPSPREKLPAPL